MARPIPDEVVLGLLKAKPTHGYDLLEVFNSPAHLGRCWRMSTSQLYAVLKRLERNGSVCGKEVDVLNAPSRIEYEITDHGCQQLDNWLFELKPSASVHRIRVEFLSRIFIANLLNHPRDPIVKGQIASCERQRDRFHSQKQTCRSDMEALTLDFIINQLDAAINWLETYQFKLSHKPRITPV